MLNILSLWAIFQQKLAKREVGTIDRSQDIARLQEFYKLYREKNNVDKLREEEMELRESGAFSGNLGEYVVLPALFSLFVIPPSPLPQHNQQNTHKQLNVISIWNVCVRACAFKSIIYICCSLVDGSITWSFISDTIQIVWWTAVHNGILLLVIFYLFILIMTRNPSNSTTIL